jgi:hypothetical protein
MASSSNPRQVVATQGEQQQAIAMQGEQQQHKVGASSNNPRWE